MEALNGLMERAVAGGFLEGFSVNNLHSTSLKVSHLLFADDALIFCGANRDQLLYLKGVLLCFEVVSGLHINLGKTEIVPVGLVPEVHDLAQVLGATITSIPMKYLGLPLGAQFKSKDMWNPIVEKMEKRLAGWKRIYLSKGGRLTLIKRPFQACPLIFSLYSPYHRALLNGWKRFRERRGIQIPFS